MAREAGVDDVVREVAPRLDYLDALDVQMKASALLLLGSNEPHYTPSKVFPALLSRRPIVAIYHEASSVLDLLREPAVHAGVITFGPLAPVVTRVEEIASALERIVHAGCRASDLCPAPFDFESLERFSARAQSGRLARVLDTVAS
jgi:hypothetical protein